MNATWENVREMLFSTDPASNSMMNKRRIYNAIIEIRTSETDSCYFDGFILGVVSAVSIISMMWLIFH